MLVKGLRAGMTTAVQRAMTAYLRDNPKATVGKWGPDGLLIEKAVEGETLELTKPRPEGES